MQMFHPRAINDSVLPSGASSHSLIPGLARC